MAKGVFLGEKGEYPHHKTIIVQSMLIYYLFCKLKKRPYTVHFIMPDGEEISVKAVEGDSMLDLAQRYDIDLECKGAKCIK